MKTERSVCPISSSLDVLGDKWSLLIVRDFMAGKKAYGEFLNSPEKISTNILSSRLKTLEQHGIIKVAGKNDRTGKAIYELTEVGEKLHPVLAAMADWALENIEGTEMLIEVPDD